MPTSALVKRQRMRRAWLSLGSEIEVEGLNDTKEIQRKGQELCIGF